MLGRVLFCLVAAAIGAAAAELQGGQVVQFAFPELPQTLESMSSGSNAPATLTARLPDNYSADRKFPLFIYLLGGPGGRGGEKELRLPAYITGRRDFICVAMPLFKDHLDPREPARGLMVAMDDFAVIARCYRTMLEKLHAEVPNITRERSTLGGHSNGAHTTGVLLAGQDPFILEHFTQFYLHEGGVGLLLANVLQKESMKAPRFLVVVGGGAPGKQAYFLPMMQVLQGLTSRSKLKFSYVSMEGYGHEQPPEYLKLIGQWTRGEPLEDFPAKLRALAAKVSQPLAEHPETADWPDLLAPDFSNAKVGPSGWAFEDGILRSGEGPLWSRTDYADFVLDLEWRGDSGAVYVRAANETDQLVTIPLGAEAAGEWHRVTVQCKDKRMRAIVNGANVFEADDVAFAHGKIGLAGNGEYRSLKILRLP